MITDNSSGFWRVISIFQVLNLQGLHVTATFNRSWTVVDVALVATWCIIGACSDNELSKKESGYVAVGMGFQNVVAWRIFELRRSHQAVQPAAPALGVNWLGN